MEGLIRRIQKNSTLLVAALLPVLTNPFAEYPFTSMKAVFFYAITAVMVSAGLYDFLTSRYRRKLATKEAMPIGQEIKDWFKTPLTLPVIIYCGLSLLSVSLSIDRSVSFWGIGNWLGGLSTIVLLAFFVQARALFKSWEGIEALSRALIFGSVPVCFYGLMQFFGLDPLAWHRGPDRITFVHATFNIHIFLGAYLAMVIPFTLTWLVRPEHRQSNQRLRYGLILFLQVLNLILSLARSAVLATMGGLLLYSWFLIGWQDRRRWLRIGLVLLVIGGMIYIALHYGLPSFIPGNSILPDMEELPALRTSSNQSRIITWKTALEIFPKRWLFGFGPQTFFEVTDPSVAGILYDPHNLLLYHLVGLGVLGTVSFMWVIISFYQVVIRALPSYDDPEKRAMCVAFLSAVTAYLLQAQVNPDTLTLVVFFWLFLAWGSAIGSLAPEKSKPMEIRRPLEEWPVGL